MKLIEWNVDTHTHTFGLILFSTIFWKYKMNENNFSNWHFQYDMSACRVDAAVQTDWQDSLSHIVVIILHLSERPSLAAEVRSGRRLTRAKVRSHL